MNHQAAAATNVNPVAQRITRRYEQSRMKLRRDVLSRVADKLISFMNTGVSSKTIFFLAMPFLIWLVVANPISFSGLSACRISKHEVLNVKSAEFTITLPSGVICAPPPQHTAASARVFKVTVGPTHGTLLNSRAGLIYRSHQNFKGDDSFSLAWPADAPANDVGPTLVKVHVKVE